jgi:hypothetical protein
MAFPAPGGRVAPQSGHAYPSSASVLYVAFFRAAHPPARGRRVRSARRNGLGTLRAYGWLVPVRSAEGRALVNASVRAQRAAPAVATALGLLTVGLAVASVPAGLLAGQSADGVVVQAVGVIPTAVVATVLAARRPRDPIGWLLLGISLLDAAGGVAVYHATLPLGSGVPASDWPMELVLIAILIWLFPDGLPRGRWRRASVVLVTAGVLLGWRPGQAASPPSRRTDSSSAPMQAAPSSRFTRTAHSGFPQPWRCSPRRPACSCGSPS